MSSTRPKSRYLDVLERADAPLLKAHRDFESLAQALVLAEEAASEIQRIARAGIEQSRKDDASLVTNADLAADALITGGLRARFPDDGILSEESGGGRAAASGRMWVVDPIDGTKAYAKQIPGFSVMIGMLVEQQPHLGVVLDPVTDAAYLALRGAGSYILDLEPRALRRAMLGHDADAESFVVTTTPSCPQTTRQALFGTATGGPVAQGTEPVGARLLPGPVINSVGIKVGVLLRGEAQVYFSHHGLSYWDTVAPIAIAHEAGARASLIDGDELVYDLLDPQSPLRHEAPLIVSAAPIHERALAMIRGRLAADRAAHTPR